jgi:hypothetical protein
MTRKYFADTKCITEGCDEPAVALDRCSACYSWRRSRIAGLTSASKDFQRYWYRVRRTVARVQMQFADVKVPSVKEIRSGTRSQKRNHFGAAA